MESTIEVQSKSFSDRIAEMHPALSWRSIVAGLLVSLFVFAVLMSLGIAIGGVSLTDGASLKNSGIMGGLWVGFSILVSLFTGGYLASRISHFASPLVGLAQGAVVASLFMGVVFWQLAGFTSWVASAAGQAVGSAANVVDNFSFSDAVEENLVGVEFKGDGAAVMAGVTARLVQGQPEAAKNYLARNSTLTRPQIDTQINAAQAQVQQAMTDARIATANALKVTGWSLFATLIVSMIGALFGGILGSEINQKIPIENADLRVGKNKFAFT